MDLSGLNDAQLMKQAAERSWHEGGEEAFWTVWRRHEDWITEKVKARRFLAPKGCDRERFCEQVRERVRENFIRGLGRYRAEGALQGFLATIIDRAAIDEYRHQKRRPREVPPREALGLNPDTTLADEEVLDAVAYRAGIYFPSPARVLEAKDRSEKIRLMLELMATESRQGAKWAKAMRWHYMEGKTQRAIANELGVSERQVARWLEDGREAAKRILEDRFNVRSLEDL